MLKTTLRPYQSEAVEKALAYDGFALFPEQRTGKCLITLALVDIRKPDVLYIVAPKKALETWEQQIEEHLEFDWDCEVHINNYEWVGRQKADKRYWRNWFRRQLKKGRTIYTVGDESHKFKKRGAVQARFMRSLGYISTWRLALTGTPMGKGPQDIWSQFDYIMRGVLEWRWEDFASTYLIYGGYQDKQVVGYRNEKKFERILHKYSFRVTFNEAKKQTGGKAPKIHRVRRWVKLKPKTWKVYRELEEELETVVDGVKVHTPLVLTLTMKLQQIAGGWVIQDERIPGKKKKKRTIIPLGREKMNELILLLLEPKLKGKKIIICARFKHELKELASVLDELQLTHKTIAGGSEYDGRFNVDAILLQIQSGIGMDLSASHTYIFYSWDHSLINFEQAKFRVLSFDTKQVDYYFLMAEGTVDEDIYESVLYKKNLVNLICDRRRKQIQ